MAAGKDVEPKHVPQKSAAQKSASQRARQRQAQVRPAAQPPSSQTGRREPRARGKFVKESWAELKKVEWPGRGQVLQGTIVVLIACIIVGAFLYGADQAFKPFVRNVLLGQ
ncbi:MAG: preprotein translocase subunit SecE [Actinobacteria bacterium]|nr:preprotein translocase subunit SecE [Actinomycetota bacterium]